MQAVEDSEPVASRLAVLEQRIARLEAGAGPTNDAEPGPGEGFLDRLERRVHNLEGPSST
jgi:hypothetical protein